MGFGFTIREILRIEIKKTESANKTKNSMFLRIDILLMVAQIPKIYRIF